jgi:tetratricopeptide (TPR) repeat protein
MYYKKALSKNKSSVEAKFGLAVSYHMLKQYDQAIEFYTQLINKDFSRQKVVNNLLVALQHKTYNEALDVLNNIDSRSAGYADILGQIGIIHIKTGDNIRAISALSKANELSPSSALVSYNLGYVYDLEKNYDYAKHFYEQAMRNGVNDVISSDDYNKLVKRVAELDKIIKAEIDKIVKTNKKQ